MPRRDRHDDGVRRASGATTLALDITSPFMRSRNARGTSGAIRRHGRSETPAPQRRERGLQRGALIGMCGLA